VRLEINLGGRGAKLEGFRAAARTTRTLGGARLQPFRPSVEVIPRGQAK
jgi:hypothetical protein